MPSDIEKWLQKPGLGEYAPAFDENRVNAEILPTLTNDDLKDIGVLAVGDRHCLCLCGHASLLAPRVE